MSFLFGGGDEEKQPTVSKLYDPFESVRNAVTAELNKKIGQKATPYTGELSPDMSAEEKQALAKASAYADTGTGSVFNLAKDEVSRVLSPDYDPSKSPFYQAVKAEAARGLELGGQQVDAAAAAGRRFNSGAKVKARTDLVTDVNNKLNTTLGGIAQTDRTNAITQAGNIQGQEDTRTQNILKLLTTLGANSREVQGTKDTAAYNEFLRQEDYPIQMLKIAMGLADKEPVWNETQPTKKKSTGINDFLPLLKWAFPGGL